MLAGELYNFPRLGSRGPDSTPVSGSADDFYSEKIYQFISGDAGSGNRVTSYDLKLLNYFIFDNGHSFKENMSVPEL